MQESHPIERDVGIGYYTTDAPGTGGRLRDRPTDFRVRELERIDPEPTDADSEAFPYLLLRVTLLNWDTNDFAAALTDRIGVSRERVAWAGTKDKRAETTQLFTLQASDLAPADVPELEDATIDVVGRLGRALRYGDLAGNSFRIHVRDAADPHRATAVTESLAVSSAPETPVIVVPNYFGHQRFGSRRAITHEVGLAILRRDWRGAVLTYIGAPSDREPSDARQARTLVDTEAHNEDPEWHTALSAMPDRLGYERAMLHRLAESDADRSATAAYREALAAVPTNLQELFVHAAQSYLFNRIVTRRLEDGLSLVSPTVGDVICFGDTLELGAEIRTDEAIGSIVVPDPKRKQLVTERRQPTADRHCARGRAFVTAPLVGTETEFGEGRPGEIEREICEAAEISRAAFDLPDPYGSAGTRRSVSVRTPIRVYLDSNADQYSLAFALPKGAYATVVAREYLQVSPEQL